MAKTRWTFSPDFEAEAVRLVTEQGRSFVEAAHDLDIGESTLRSSRQAIIADGERTSPAGGARQPTSVGPGNTSAAPSRGSNCAKNS